MSPARMDRVESGMRAAVEYITALNNQDIIRMLQVVSEDCIADEANENIYKGKTDIEKMVRKDIEEHAKMHRDVEEFIGFGNRCIMRWKCMWVDTDGQERAQRGVDIIKTKDGLICEKLSYVKD